MDILKFDIDIIIQIFHENINFQIWKININIQNFQDDQFNIHFIDQINNIYHNIEHQDILNDYLQ